MAVVGYSIITRGLFGANDDNLYTGVASFSLNADQHTLNLVGVSGANTSNFGTTAAINLQTIKMVQILRSQLYGTDDSPGDRTPGT
jgi:hypothetical protein